MSRKQRRKQNVNLSVESEDNVFKFVSTITGIIVLLILVYLVVGIFFTKEINLNKKDDKKKTKENVTIDNKTITAGQIFDQKDNTYYVLIYDFDSKLTNLSSLLTNFTSDEKNVVYKVDSKSKINSNFIVKDNSNTSPTTYDDLKIKSPTLIKIENKTVTSYIEKEEEIKKVLKGE